MEQSKSLGKTCIPGGEILAEVPSSAARRNIPADQPLSARGLVELVESGLTGVGKPRTYFGGKDGSGTYQVIINQIRPHEVYMELFAGGAAIMRRKRPAKYSILSDLDLQPLSVLLDECKRTGYKLCTLDESAPYVALSRDEPDGFTAVQLRHADYTSILKDVEWYTHRMQRICMYLDPPYPHSSRKSGGKSRYRYEFTNEDHERFFQFVHALPSEVDVLISTYPNDRYREEFSGWRLIEFQSVTHAGLATEWLFVNYSAPKELHDYRYVGDDHRDRLDFSRMKSRWKKKLEKLPPVKRRALLQHLLGGEPVEEFFQR